MFPPGSTASAFTALPMRTKLSAASPPMRVEKRICPLEGFTLVMNPAGTLGSVWEIRTLTSGKSEEFVCPAMTRFPCGSSAAAFGWSDPPPPNVKLPAT
jgi:hypothetical protein